MSGLFGQNRPGGPGLSINTGTANSLFGSNTQQAQTTSAAEAKPLFGSTTNSSAAGTLFGNIGSTNTSQASNPAAGTATSTSSTAGTLFGGTAANKGTSLFGSLGSNQPAQQNTQAGSLFGQTNANTNTSTPFGAAASQPQATSLFGNTQNQPQQSTSLFGNTQAQPQQSTSLFGNTGNQQQSTSLFGNAQANQTSSLFGSAPGQGGGLFGSQNKPAGASINQPAQNAQSTLFPQPSTTLHPPQQPQQSAFSASIGQYTAASQSIPGVRIDISNLRPTTRFEDLHESLQQDITNLDSFILQNISAADDCASALPKIRELGATVPKDVDYCAKKLETTRQSLIADAVAVDRAKQLVRADAEVARRSFKAIHALRMPAQFHVSGLWNAGPPGGGGGGATYPSPAGLDDRGGKEEGAGADGKESADLTGYFSDKTAEMGKRLDQYKKNLKEIESYISGIESNLLEQIQKAQAGHGGEGETRSKEDVIRELATVLREFEGGILTVAGQVGGLREGTQELMLGEVRSDRRRR